MKRQPAIVGWTSGVVEALGIPEGDSWSSRGQRPRKTASTGVRP